MMMKQDILIEDKVPWTDDAENALRRIPGMIRKMVKRQIEKSAVEKGLKLITLDFVLEMKKRSMGGGDKKKKLTLEDFYANTDKAPILAGFKRKTSIHPGMNSVPVDMDNYSVLWNEIAFREDTSRRRSLYIHIPFCLARCKFCSFYHSRTTQDALQAYMNDLMQELAFVSESKFAKSRPFNAVYFGGGTPTDLSPDDLCRCLKHLNNYWNLANDCEITVEGRIHGFDDDKIEACIANGVNRFSFGVQTFNTKIRRQMGRIETREKIVARLADIASLNQTNISIDLIYGFPDQSNEIWQDDIRTAAECAAIDSASIYRLKFMPESPIIDQVKEGKLSPVASLEQQAELFMMSNDYYRSINAFRVGVTHWAFTNRERCIYNTSAAYGGSCLPIGCGAGGSVGQYRLMQRMELDDYSAKIANKEKPIAMASKMPADSAIGAAISGGLSLHLGLNFNELAKQFELPDLLNIFTPLLVQWERAGMLTFNRSAATIKLTDAGEFHCVSLAQNMIDFYRLK